MYPIEGRPKVDDFAQIVLSRSLIDAAYHGLFIARCGGQPENLDRSDSMLTFRITFFYDPLVVLKFSFQAHHVCTDAGNDRLPYCFCFTS
jgi:hypothetical protein